MNKMKGIIILLNKMGHDIQYREYAYPTSGKKLYITSIDGTNYKTTNQTTAHKRIDKILEELDE